MKSEAIETDTFEEPKSYDSLLKKFDNLGKAYTKLFTQAQTDQKTLASQRNEVLEQQAELARRDILIEQLRKQLDKVNGDFVEACKRVAQEAEMLAASERQHRQTLGKVAEQSAELGQYIATNRNDKRRIAKLEREVNSLLVETANIYEQLTAKFLLFRPKVPHALRTARDCLRQITIAPALKQQ